MHFNFFKLRIFKTKSKSKLKLTFSSADKEMIFQNKKTGQNKNWLTRLIASGEIDAHLSLGNLRCAFWMA